MRLNLEDIKITRPRLSKKGIEVISNMELDKEYSFTDLNCSYMTWYSLLCQNCISHIGAAMLPTHKIGTFKINKNLLFDIQYCKLNNITL